MSDSVAVRIQLPQGDVVTSTISIRLQQSSSSWVLSHSEIEVERDEFVGHDIFEALKELRRTLEAEGAELLCAGARPEAIPSGMSRSMGGGRKAYVTKLGQQALMDSIVEIFDYAGPEAVGSVGEQVSYCEKWFESLRKL